MNQQQIDFIKKLDYVDGYEIKDLMAGHTASDVLLDPDDLEKFVTLGHWSEVCRHVLEEGPIKYNGSLIDAYTASAVCQVVDGLNEEARARFLACPFHKAISITWKLCK